MATAELEQLKQAIEALESAIEAEHQQVVATMNGYLKSEHELTHTLGLHHTVESLNHSANRIDDLGRQLAMKQKMLSLLRLERHQ